MKNFFKPEDFENLSVTYDEAVPESAALLANAKLEKLRAENAILREGLGSIADRNAHGVMVTIAREALTAADKVRGEG